MPPLVHALFLQNSAGKTRGKIVYFLLKMTCAFVQVVSIITIRNVKGEKMKTTTLFGALVGAMVIGGAMAADITIYYSPTCPHCHHAREFISENLIYEYPNLNVTTVNVMDAANRDEFIATLKKCEYESGGVPVMVVGEKCFQGYGDSMAESIRAAIEVDMDDSAKATAAENKKAMESDADSFRTANANRMSAIVERVVEKTEKADAKKKLARTNENWFYYGILAVLVIGLIFVLGRKKNK